jgi:hypothetical protein
VSPKSIRVEVPPAVRPARTRTAASSPWQTVGSPFGPSGGDRPQALPDLASSTTTRKARAPERAKPLRTHAVRRRSAAGYTSITGWLPQRRNHRPTVTAREPHSSKGAAWAPSASARSVMRLFDVQATEIHVAYRRLFEFVKDPSNLPKWAHAFKSANASRATLQTRFTRARVPT